MTTRGSQANDDSIRISDASVPSRNASSVQEEEFDTFLEKFERDSSFQISRIMFPLELEAGDETRLLYQNDWRFTTLSNKQPIRGQIKKVRTATGKVYVQYSIEDTGVLVNHYFEIKNGKWRLVSIHDESD